MGENGEQEKPAVDLAHRKGSYMFWGGVIGAVVPLIWFFFRTALRIAEAPDYDNFIESLYWLPFALLTLSPLIALAAIVGAIAGYFSWKAQVSEETWKDSGE